MARKRRVFSPALMTAKAALAAGRGDRTTPELAAQFSVHARQITRRSSV